MLKANFLKTIQGLSNLTDDQLQLIENASRTDEDTVIGQKVKEIHDKYDQDIENIIGVKKPGGVKSYDHLRTQLTELKSKSDTAGDNTALKSEINSLKLERDNLKAKIAEGSTDEALKQELESVKRKLTDKQDELENLKNNLNSQNSTLQESLKKEKEKNAGFMIDSSINDYYTKNNLKYNETFLKQPFSDRILTAEKDDFKKSLNVEFDPELNSVIVRDPDGKIIYDKDDNFNPISIGKMFFEREGVKGLLKEQRQQTGAGTGAGGAGGAGGSSLDLSGVSTQIKADAAIREHIFKNEGIAKTDPRFDERHQQLRQEHKVSDMDVR